MTVKLLAPYGSISAGARVTLPMNTENALVTQRQAQSLVAQWDASQLAPVANGTAVGLVPDTSGNGYDAVQASGTLQPTYRTAANWGGGGTGRPALRFDGIDDYLATSLTTMLMGTGDYTVFLVYATTAATNTAGLRDMRVFSNEASRMDRGWAFTTSDNNGGGGSSVHCLRGGGGEVDVGSAIVVNTPYIVSVVQGAQFFINGTRQAPSHAALPPMLPRVPRFNIGTDGSGAGSVALAGDVALIEVHSMRFSDAARQAREAALAARYAITVATQPTV